MKLWQRTLRGLEEMLELSQSVSVTEEEVLIVLRQVYDKPRGIPRKELGGCLVTLCGIADSLDLDLEECFWDEFEVIMDPAKIAKIRQRNLAGDKIGIALNTGPVV